MEIPPSIPPSKAPSPEMIRASLGAWTAGQVLDATIVTRVSPQQLLLRVGNVTFQTHSDAAVPAGFGADGARIRVMVERGGDVPALRIMTPTDQSTVSALRQWIPRQQPLTQLFANLSQLILAPGHPNSGLPSTVTESIQKLMRSLPRATELRTPEQMKQAIRDSGAFLESKLAGSGKGSSPSAQHHSVAAADFKANLLRLFAQLSKLAPSRLSEPATALQKTTGETPMQFSDDLTGPATPSAQARLPPLPLFSLQPQTRAFANLAIDMSTSLLLQQLTEQTDGALSRMHAIQLSHTQERPDSLLPSWTLELPLRLGDNVDVVQLRWQRDDTSGSDPAQRAWTINLSFDFPETGPLWIDATLIGKTVSTTIRTSRTATAEKIRHELPYLESLLQNAGLTVGQLGCVNHPPVAAQPARVGLIDTHI